MSAVVPSVTNEMILPKPYVKRLAPSNIKVHFSSQYRYPGFLNTHIIFLTLIYSQPCQEVSVLVFYFHKMSPHLLSFCLKFSGALLVKLTHNQFSNLFASYHHTKICCVLDDLDMLGFFHSIFTCDFHGDPCFCLSRLLLTAAMVMHVIDGFLESSATQHFCNCIINNSINCSPLYLLLIY